MEEQLIEQICLFWKVRKVGCKELLMKNNFKLDLFIRLIIIIITFGCLNDAFAPRKSVELRIKIKEKAVSLLLF